MKEFNLVTQEKQEDSFDHEDYLNRGSPSKTKMKRMNSKTSEKKETERRLNEILDKRRDRN
jgi:hypothetical protein